MHTTRAIDHDMDRDASNVERCTCEGIALSVGQFGKLEWLSRPVCADTEPVGLLHACLPSLQELVGILAGQLGMVGACVPLGRIAFRGLACQNPAGPIQVEMEKRFGVFFVLRHT